MDASTYCKPVEVKEILFPPCLFTQDMQNSKAVKPHEGEENITDFCKKHQKIEKQFWNNILEHYSNESLSPQQAETKINEEIKLWQIELSLKSHDNEKASNSSKTQASTTSDCNYTDQKHYELRTHTYTNGFLLCDGNIRLQAHKAIIDKSTVSFGAIVSLKDTTNGGCFVNINEPFKLNQNYTMESFEKFILKFVKWKFNSVPVKFKSNQCEVQLLSLQNATQDPFLFSTSVATSFMKGLKLWQGLTLAILEIRPNEELVNFEQIQFITLKDINHIEPNDVSKLYLHTRKTGAISLSVKDTSSSNKSKNIQKTGQVDNSTTLLIIPLKTTGRELTQEQIEDIHILGTCQSGIYETDTRLIEKDNFVSPSKINFSKIYSTSENRNIKGIAVLRPHIIKINQKIDNGSEEDYLHRDAQMIQDTLNEVE